MITNREKHHKYIHQQNKHGRKESSRLLLSSLVFGEQFNKTYLINKWKIIGLITIAISILYSKSFQ